MLYVIEINTAHHLEQTILEIQTPCNKSEFEQ